MSGNQDLAQVARLLNLAGSGGSRLVGSANPSSGGARAAPQGPHFPHLTGISSYQGGGYAQERAAGGQGRRAWTSTPCHDVAAQFGNHSCFNGGSG